MKARFQDRALRNQELEGVPMPMIPHCRVVRWMIRITGLAGRQVIAVVGKSGLLALALGFAAVTSTYPSHAEEGPDPSHEAGHSAPALRDGQHDFDFEVGRWRTHLRRLLKPLTGSTTWVEYDGTSTVRNVWNGRANLLELDVDGPAGRIVALSLRLYDPHAHQWSLNFSNAASGTMSTPSLGEFKNGRGEFYDQEALGNRTILVRFVIEPSGTDAYRFEQAFSDDGGKTWEVNWIATDTRAPDEGPAAPTG